MTVKEKNKLEKMCLVAIKNCEWAERSFEEYKNRCPEMDLALAELRRADSDYSYALGIHNVLKTLGYKSENMEKLTKMISD